MYSFCCLTKFSCNFWILGVGRIFGGISTSMLFSTFESWYVYEHVEHFGFPSEWIGVTFSRSVYHVFIDPEAKNDFWKKSEKNFIDFFLMSNVTKCVVWRKFKLQKIKSPYHSNVLQITYFTYTWVGNFDQFYNEWVKIVNFFINSKLFSVWNPFLPLTI